MTANHNVERNAKTARGKWEHTANQRLNCNETTQPIRTRFETGPIREAAKVVRATDLAVDHCQSFGCYLPRVTWSKEVISVLRKYTENL